MGGSITPDHTCSCSGKFQKKTFRKQVYFACNKCDSEPRLYRIRRYLPSPTGGKGKTYDIRYDQNGNRLTDIDSARATQRYIDGLVKSNRFDPSEFMIKDANNNYLFDNFVNNVYLPYYERRVEAGSFKPSSMVSKKNILKNHLLPFLRSRGVRSIKHIHDGVINDIHKTLPASARMRDMTIEELKTLMGYARMNRYVDINLNFPRLKKPTLKNPETFLSPEEQQKVLDCVEDQRYKTMLSIMCLIAIRPSEVRALKWSDWDFKNGKLWIRRHVTIRSIVVPGRKSNADTHSIRLSKELTALIEHMARPINKDTYMFPGDHQEIVSEHCLPRAWNRAIKKAGIKHIDSYRGSKSSTMSNWLRRGYSVSMISAFTGLSEEDVKRYAQHNAVSIEEIQSRIIGG